MLRPNKIISIFCCILVFWLPTTAYADSPKIEAESVSPGVITELRKGQHAPFSGILFSRDAAVKMYTQLKFTEEECKLRLSKELDILKLDYETRLKLINLKLDVESEKNQKLIAVKNDRIKFLEKNLNPPKWYESGEFWFSMGVVGGILITVVSAYAIGQAAK